MIPQSILQCSVVIPTYNRAEELRKTLSSLAGVRVSRLWEAVVVRSLDSRFKEESLADRVNVNAGGGDGSGAGTGAAPAKP